MLWMHKRPFGDRNDVLPLGHWESLQVRSEGMYGTPVFDGKDSFAMTIYNKVENGTIRMASAGLIPVEWEENGSLLSKSILEECSLVDIGANNDALAVTLYNQQRDVVNLSTLNLHNTYIQSLLARSWDDLDRTNKLKELKAKNFDLYATKFSEKFGKYPDGYTTSSAGHSPYIMNLFSKSFKELSMSDGLANLKKQAPDLYREKFFQEFGQYPTI